MSSGLPPPPPGLASGRSGLPPPPPGMGQSHGGLPPPPPGMRPNYQGGPPSNNSAYPQPPSHQGTYPQPPSQHASGPPRSTLPPPPMGMGQRYPPQGSGPGGLPPPPQGMQPHHHHHGGPPAPSHQGGGYQHGGNAAGAYPPMSNDSRYPRPPGDAHRPPYQQQPPPPQQQYNAMPLEHRYPRPPGGGGDHQHQYPQTLQGDHQQHYQGQHQQQPYGQQQQRQPYQGGGGGGSSYHQPRQFETRDPTNTAWVGNLDAQHTDDAIRTAFAPFGRIMRVARVDGKNFLFVHFRTKEEAQAAVQTLSASGTLGRARFNYGKQFDYSPEEMSLPWNPQDPFQHQSSSQGYGDGGGGGYNSRSGDHRGDTMMQRPKRQRDDDNSVPASNILWVGSIPATLSTDELRQNFESFGTINQVSRLNERGMAFIHFSSVEECQHALDVMRGQPIAGVVLTLNYGRAARNDGPGGSDGAGGGGSNPNEQATNVVYLGNIASNVTHDEVDRMFDEYEGFINAKYISGSGIAFGHFETIDNSRACRTALQGRLLGGAPFRVNFGKTNHTMTMADKKGAYGGGGGGGGGGVDPSTIDPFNASALFALTTTSPGAEGGNGGGELTIPSMGSGAVVAVGSSVPKYYTRDRPQPMITIDTRLAALAAATYHNCGEQEKNLRPNVVQATCDAIDECVDTKTEEALDTAMSYFAPLNAAHLFALCAKRLREFFNDDRHKKLHVLYACTRVLFGTRTAQLQFSKAAMWSFLVLIAVVVTEQDELGLAQIRMVVDKLKTAAAFCVANRLDDAYLAEFYDQLDVVMERAKADQEMAQFAKRRRK